MATPLTKVFTETLIIREVKFADLLMSHMATIANDENRHWLLAIPNGRLPNLVDEALVIKLNRCARNLPTKLDHCENNYVVDLNLGDVHDVLEFNRVLDGNDEAADRLRALVYYVRFDSFYNRSPASEANWLQLVKSYGETRP